MEKGSEEMTTEPVQLPKDLQDAQERINAWHKDQQLKNIVGKFYSRHSGPGYPSHLRRIYWTKINEIRVDDYSLTKEAGVEFKFKSYLIMEIQDLYDQREFREVEDVKVWYDCLDRFLNLEPINSLVVTRQGKVIENLKTSNREHEKSANELAGKNGELMGKLDSIKWTVDNQVGDKSILVLVDKIQKILEKNNDNIQ